MRILALLGTFYWEQANTFELQVCASCLLGRSCSHLHPVTKVASQTSRRLALNVVASREEGICVIDDVLYARLSSKFAFVAVTKDGYELENVAQIWLNIEGWKSGQTTFCRQLFKRRKWRFRNLISTI